MTGIFWGSLLWAIYGLFMVFFILSPQPGSILPQTWGNVKLAVPYYVLVGAGIGVLFVILFKVRSTGETGCFTIVVGVVLGLVLGEVFSRSFHVIAAKPMDFIVWRLLCAFFALIATAFMFQFTVRTVT